ncbi:MAG: cytochrome P460 family protein [Sterolibacteriaceae bacterium]|nr:cytochrome P460 family protein [Sterolibacteriaceae bacterium]
MLHRARPDDPVPHEMKNGQRPFAAKDTFDHPRHREWPVRRNFQGFEGFKGDSLTDRAVGKNAATACYECHTAQKDKDYVFSTLRR